MSVLEQNSRRKPLLGNDGNALTYLLIFNAVIFVILSFLKVLYLINKGTVPQFEAEVMQWVNVPAQPHIFASRPWTLLTYMFSHIDVWFFISNILWIWSFGYILQDMAGNKKIFPVYLYAGLAGSIAFILTVNLLPEIKFGANALLPLSGAGPALMGLAIATTCLAPRYKIFPLINGGIPLWILTAVFVLINIASVGMASVGYAAAQVAGGLMGFVFVWQLKKGNDLGQWMDDFVVWINDLFNPDAKKSKEIKKQKLYYRAQESPFVKMPHITQQRVDELLDKINHKGYHFLTDEEKEFLKKASKEDF